MFSKAISQGKHFQKCKNILFFQLFQKQNCTFVLFSVKKCILGIATGSKAKRYFLVYGTFPCVADSFFVEKTKTFQNHSKMFPKQSLFSRAV